MTAVLLYELAPITSRSPAQSATAASVARPRIDMNGFYRTTGNTKREAGNRRQETGELVAALHRRGDLAERLLGVAEDHHRLRQHEELVLDARESGFHGPLQHDHRLGLVHVQDRHPEDGTPRRGLRR